MLFDFEALTARECHKILISTIVPRPIAWVTTLNQDGTVNVGPFSFFNVVCEDPPLIAIGIGSGERGVGDHKDTSTNIRRTRDFVVNLVSHANTLAMVSTAVNLPAGVSELEAARLSPSPSTRVGPPRITESPVSLECVVYQLVDLPQGRALILGRVLAAHLRDDVVLDRDRCQVDTPKLDLIARMHGAGWYTRMTDWFQALTPKI